MSTVDCDVRCTSKFFSDTVSILNKELEVSAEKEPFYNAGSICAEDVCKFKSKFFNCVDILLNFILNKFVKLNVKDETKLKKFFIDTAKEALDEIKKTFKCFCCEDVYISLKKS